MSWIISHNSRDLFYSEKIRRDVLDWRIDPLAWGDGRFDSISIGLIEFRLSATPARLVHCNTTRCLHSWPIMRAVHAIMKMFQLTHGGAMVDCSVSLAYRQRDVENETMATKVCDKTIGDASVRFAFTNGKVLECEFVALPPAIERACVLHGISARVGDTYANAASHPDPVEWAYQTACATWQAMCGGEWSQRRDSPALAEALSRASGRTIDEAIAAIATLDDATKKKLAKTPAIKLALAQIAVERAQAKLGSEAAIDIETLI